MLKHGLFAAPYGAYYVYTTIQKFGISYVDVFLLSFNRDKNSIIQTPNVLFTLEIVLAPKEE